MAAATFSPLLRQAEVRKPSWRPIPGVARLRTLLSQSRGHGTWIVLWSLVGWVGTALAPTLTDMPLLLMLLSPRALFVALASGSVSLIPFVVLGTLRLSVTDASYFIMGSRFPQDTDAPPSTTARAGTPTRLMRRIGRKGDALCRWFCARPKLAGAFLFLRPNSKYLAVAGAYRVSPWLAGISAVTGTAAFLTAVHVGIGAIF